MEPEWHKAVIGASTSVEVFAPRFSASGVDPTLVLSVSDVADSRLIRRAVIGFSGDPYLSAKLKLKIRDLEMTGWEVRRTERGFPFAALIIDGSTAYITERSQTSRRRNFLVRDETTLAMIRRIFEQSGATAEPSLVYQSANTDQDRSPPQLFVDFSSQWSQIFEALKKNPAAMFQMPPRRFEEMIAELVERDGMQAILTPATRDGGRDILAYSTDRFGKHLYLVECKRYAPDRLVSVDIVRALYGVVELERATGGVLVTTSQLSADGREFLRALGYRMGSREYSDIVDWIQKHG